MVNKFRLQASCWDGPRCATYEVSGQLLQIAPAEARKIDKFLGHLKRNRKAYIMFAAALAYMLLPGSVEVFAAAGKMSGGRNIILLLQKASFWVGMGITIWGIVEAQLDFPGWKGRILKGILGYIGILLVPLVFLELQSSLQVDVWDSINKGTQDIDSMIKGVQP